MKKFVSLLLLLSLLLAQSAFAAIQTEPTVYAQVKPADPTQATANVYQLPGEYREIIGTIKKDAYIFITFEGSTWHKVKAVSGSTGSLGEFGWAGAAGGAVFIDTDRNLAMFYAHHMLNPQEEYYLPRVRNVLYHCLSD
jgi:hypothetical protein